MILGLMQLLVWTITLTSQLIYLVEAHELFDWKLASPIPFNHLKNILTIALVSTESIQAGELAGLPLTESHPLAHSQEVSFRPTFIAGN